LASPRLSLPKGRRAEANTAQRSDSPAQPFIQCFPEPVVRQRLAYQRPAYLATLRALIRCAQAFERYSARHVRTLGLTPAQFDVIATLGNTDGMTCRALGERTLITKGTLTGVLDRLTKRGLITREGVPGDARRSHVRLTPAGDQVFAEVFPAHLAYCAKAFGRLEEAELSQLTLALDRLCAAFEQAGADGGGNGGDDEP